MRILLCDNHRLLVEALSAALRDRGHQVVAVTTIPEDAVDAAVQHDPDVCLLDVVFPGGHGIDTVARIRATTRSKVLVLSAQCDGDAVCAALDAGAAGFVGKSQGIEDVLRSLEQVCAGKMTMPAANASGGPRRSRPSEPMALRFLTGREREALRLIAEGESTKEIAQSMHVAYSTARTHVQNVLTKLGVRSRLQAAAFAARAGVVDELGDRTVTDGLPSDGGSRSNNRRSGAVAGGAGTAVRISGRCEA